jgi:hypothetical protein
MLLTCMGYGSREVALRAETRPRRPRPPPERYLSAEALYLTPLCVPCVGEGGVTRSVSPAINPSSPLLTGPLWVTGRVLAVSTP